MVDLNFEIEVDRIGLEPPKFQALALLDNRYYRAFDQYFNDNFTLRGPLTFTKNWLDYHVFHSTDSSKVHVGANGWLYDRKSIQVYRKEACYQQAFAHKLALGFHAVEKIVEASGRRLIVTIAPDKSTIYPEFVGFVPKGDTCDSSLYDLFLENVNAHPLESFARCDRLLREWKKRGALLYEKTDAHWNSLGATVVSQAIVRKVYDQKWPYISDFSSLDTGASGDLMVELMGLAAGTEEVSFKHFEGSDRSVPLSAVIYGDSSTLSLAPYMSKIFREVDVIKSDSIPSKQHGEKLSSYDVIVFSVAESRLRTTNLQLDKIFSDLCGEKLTDNRPWVDLQTVAPILQVSAHPRADGLEIKSLGGESVFDLESVPASDDETFRILMLSIESSRPDVMTIECAGQPYTMRRSLKQGLTDVYLPLPFGHQSLCLRINPGSHPGLFMLRSARIFGFPRHSDVTLPTQPEQSVTMMEASHGLRHVTSGEDLESSEPFVDWPAPPQEDGVKKCIDEKAVPRIRRQIIRKPILDRRNTSETLVSHDLPPLPAEAKPMRDSASHEPAPTDPKKSPEEIPSINVTEYEEGRILQRRGTSADVLVSGTYIGVPVAVEARVVKNDTSEQVVPWIVVDTSPENGIFMGMLDGVPQGGWYDFQVRFVNDHNVIDHGMHKWGVGILIACIGQSNMKEWFHTGTDLEAHPLLFRYANKKWLGLGKKGNGAIAFGNRLINRLGLPVGLIDYSVNGSGLRKEADWRMGYWEDLAENSIYNRFLAGVSAAGGFLEFVIWMQGEADAARGTVSEVEYSTSLERFVTKQVRADIGNGSSRKNLPFLIVMMIKRPGGEDGPNQAIRNAQNNVAQNVADCYLAATTLDLKNQGTQHLTHRAYTNLGFRVAQTVLFLLGKEEYYRGPSVVGVTQIDTKNIDVAIRHRGGTDFTPASGISGWEVVTEDLPAFVSEVNRHDAQTIRITLKDPITGPAHVRYLHGAMPDTANPVRDNSPLSLPLEEYEQKQEFQR